MERIKSFSEFVNETLIENQADADIHNNNKKKMKKNSYNEAEEVKKEKKIKKGKTIHSFQKKEKN